MPIFAARIEDWEPHLQRMFSFWESVALMAGTYHGRPMQKHLPLPIDGRHFDRWLELFEAAARELCPPKAAAHFAERAQRIGALIELMDHDSQFVFFVRMLGEILANVAGRASDKHTPPRRIALRKRS